MIALLLGLLAACDGTPQDVDAPDDDTAQREPPDCGDGTCVADDGETVETCPWDCGFRYLVLVDLQTNNDGESPGVDLDAIGLERGDDLIWLAAVAGAEIRGDENAFTDPDHAVGAPDATCESESVVSLGGRGAWIAGHFGDDVVLRVGDRLQVFERSDQMCEDESRNDRWELLLATGPHPLDGEWIGSGSGVGVVEVGPW